MGTVDTQVRQVRVDLEHRGWERLGEEAMETRQDHVNGWPRILASYDDGTRASP